MVSLVTPEVQCVYVNTCISCQQLWVACDVVIFILGIVPALMSSLCHTEHKQ